MRLSIFFYSLFVIAFSCSAIAHGTTSSTKKRAETEQEAVDQRLHLALRLNGSELNLSVTDRSGSTVDMDAASATVLVSNGKNNAWFTLLPNDTGQLLSGQGKFTPNKETRFDVTLRLPGERPINASFTPAISEKPISMKQ